MQDHDVTSQTFIELLDERADLKAREWELCSTDGDGNVKPSGGYTNKSYYRRLAAVEEEINRRAPPKP
jgi:hypothetical protein